MTVLFDNTDLTVEMAFGDPPLDESPTWTDVTAYVRKVDINRGRSSEYSTYSPGTARIELDNRDRRFDPEHTSSPYVNDLVPMVQVRIKARYSTGVDHYIFRGFVQGWPTTYNQSNTDAVSTVTAIDGGRILGNTLLPASAFAKEVTDEDPFVYFPLQSIIYRDDLTGVSRGFVTESDDGQFWMYLAVDTGYARVSTQAYPIGQSNAISTGIFSYVAQFIDFYGQGTDIPDVTGLEFYFSGNDEDLNGNYSFSVKFNSDITGEGQSVFALFFYNGSTGLWYVNQIRYENEAANAYANNGVQTQVSVIDGMNHVVLTKDGSALVLYVNGSSVMTASIGTGAGSSYESTPFLKFSSGTDTDRCPVSHIAAHTSELSPTDVTRHYNAGLGYNPELSSARLGRVLDDAGWPTNWRNIDVGDQQVNGYLPERLPAIRYIDQINVAEQGDIYVNRFGSVQSVDRTRTNKSIPDAFFDPETGDLPFTAVNLDGNSTDTIRNYVLVSYANGEIIAQDASSITAYGTSSERIDARLIDNGTSAQVIADTRLARAKDPRTRITQLTVDVRADAAELVDAMASLDIADDVVVAFTPTNVGDPVWRAVRVQGISHSITPDSWTSTLYLAPGSTGQNGPLFILNDSNYGELNDGNKLG